MPKIVKNQNSINFGRITIWPSITRRLTQNNDVRALNGNSRRKRIISFLVEICRRRYGDVRYSRRKRRRKAEDKRQRSFEVVAGADLRKKCIYPRPTFKKRNFMTKNVTFVNDDIEIQNN